MQEDCRSNPCPVLRGTGTSMCTCVGIICKLSVDKHKRPNGTRTGGQDDLVDGVGIRPGAMQRIQDTVVIPGTAAAVDSR